MVVAKRLSVPSRLGRLSVECVGAGPPVVLWHSLFVDSTSWGPLPSALSRDRTVIAIDGPSHGRSAAVPRDFTFAECVGAAVDALDGLGLDGPVDWVGNAWGGHIGVHIAATRPARLRTLATIGTPVAAFTRREKALKALPLMALYRVVGANAFLVKQLSDSLLGSEAVAREPERAAQTMDAFRRADRQAMMYAMGSMMLHRAGMEHLLPKIAVPTLVMTARDDVMGWRPEEARRTCALIPHCRVEEVDGAGHISPLLIDHERIIVLLRQWWAETPQPV